ncbi:hypothetical protein PR202_ga30235 [Eleusine coracana subsp. coracana]|uniref:C2H2-type domain-containing protein n=1 Tax=Eleusine coracana subsp. coracana TaxID=191504 RepID=A0AAV5DMX6_ELECO|nr:hypothetical protein PR202_ga30235 [Eleusine coracana subsp. coracana]
MTIQVIAEREHKIRSEVEEIRKVFFCSLCNKQYKLAHEFESHLSSYDHNHRKRFKEMREMQSSSGSRDDRQKREQQRQEKELAKIAQQADAHRKQQQQKQEMSDTPVESVAPRTTAAPVKLDQRQTLKFGFSRMAPSKVHLNKQEWLMEPMGEQLADWICGSVLWSMSMEAKGYAFTFIQVLNPIVVHGVSRLVPVVMDADVLFILSCFLFFIAVFGELVLHALWLGICSEIWCHAN